MDKNYYVNVKELMENEYTELPRPTLKHLILLSSGEDPK